MIFTSPYFLFHILQRSSLFSEVGIVILGFPVIAKWLSLALLLLDGLHAKTTRMV